jgi:lipooligosaccharide transport system permease protein
MVNLLLPTPGRLAEVSQRATMVAERNVVSLRAGTWIALLSGFCEPFLYLLSIGVGLGPLIGDVPLPGGRTTSYPAFLAPAMMASYAMSSALAETAFAFFGRMRFLRLYDSILATPVRPFEIALGELAWATVRVGLYSIGFVGIMAAMGLTSPQRAIVAVPATLLAAFAFGSIGIALATVVRGWQDFDAMNVVQLGMFMFSGTFAPVDAYPEGLRWLVQLTPLYQAVALMRAITTGSVGWGQLCHVGYLVAIAVIGLAVASRRMRQLLTP